MGDYSLSGAGTEEFLGVPYSSPVYDHRLYDILLRFAPDASFARLHWLSFRAYLSCCGLCVVYRVVLESAQG